VPLETVIRGLSRALAESPVEASLLLCVQREFGAKAAAEALTRAIPYLPKSVIIALGMDGSELGHPPRNFVLAYGEAAALRLHRVAHAGMMRSGRVLACTFIQGQQQRHMSGMFGGKLVTPAVTWHPPFVSQPYSVF
jgi:adenosine deaminase